MNFSIFFFLQQKKLPIPFSTNIVKDLRVTKRVLRTKEKKISSLFMFRKEFGVIPDLLVSPFRDVKAQGEVTNCQDPRPYSDTTPTLVPRIAGDECE